MDISTSLSTFVPKSISSWSTLKKTITSPDQHFEGHGTSLNPCLPWWAIKTIEVVGPDVGDISLGR